MTNTEDDMSNDGMYGMVAKAEILEFLDRRLKKVNDTYGYCRGDERLECTGRIRELLELIWRIERESDTLETEDRFTDILKGVTK